jgi:hypothetical protein
MDMCTTLVPPPLCSLHVDLYQWTFPTTLATLTVQLREDLVGEQSVVAGERRMRLKVW